VGEIAWALRLLLLLLLLVVVHRLCQLAGEEASSLPRVYHLPGCPCHTRHSWHSWHNCYSWHCRDSWHSRDSWHTRNSWHSCQGCCGARPCQVSGAQEVPGWHEGGLSWHTSAPGRLVLRLRLGWGPGQECS